MNSPTIMIIDDDLLSNTFNTMIIQITHPDAEIQVYTNALEAMENLKNIQKVKPDLIFLDLNMPMMNGWDFLEEYKKLDLNISIVLVTSSNDPDDKLKLMKYKEIKRYFVKPISIDNLQDITQII